MRFRIVEYGPETVKLYRRDGKKLVPIGDFPSSDEAMGYIREMSGEEPRIIREVLIIDGGKRECPQVSQGRGA